MHPLLLLVLVFVLKDGGRKKPYIRKEMIFPEPLYFDTFRMELMLDRLRVLTETLEKVNRLSQVNQLSDALELLGGFGGTTSLLQAVEPFLGTALKMKENDGI